jgi:hypothetical protein
MALYSPRSRGCIPADGGQNGAILDGLRVPGRRAIRRRMIFVIAKTSQI